MDAILPTVLAYLFSAMAVLLSALVSWALYRWSQRVESQVLSQKIAVLRHNVAPAAIRAAEKWAHSRTKSSGRQPDGVQKLRYAVAAVRHMVPGTKADEAEAFIEAALQEYQELQAPPLEDTPPDSAEVEDDR